MRENKVIDVSTKYDYVHENMKHLNHFLDIPLTFLKGKYPGERSMTAWSNGKSYDTDPDNEYLVNSLGYRDAEFVKNKTDILCAGCSHTFGIGVPQVGTWPEILKSISGLNTVNLGVPGISVQESCENIVKYCEKYGNPKYIFCLFPDFLRMLFYEDLNFHTTRDYNNSNYSNEDLNLTSMNIITCWKDVSGDQQQLIANLPDKFVKNPIPIYKNISPHQAILTSIDAIFYLEKYCKSNNINLVWTSWDNRNIVVLNKLNKLNNFKLCNYSEFTDIIETSNNPNEFANLCKKDHNTYMTSIDSWDMGSDRYKNEKFWPHPGIHYQWHVAEFFNKKIGE